MHVERVCPTPARCEIRAAATPVMMPPFDQAECCRICCHGVSVCSAASSTTPCACVGRRGIRAQHAARESQSFQLFVSRCARREAASMRSEAQREAAVSLSVPTTHASSRESIGAGRELPNSPFCLHSSVTVIDLISHSAEMTTAFRCTIAE